MTGFSNDFMYNATMGGYNNPYGAYNYGNYGNYAGGPGFTGTTETEAAQTAQAGGGGLGLGTALLGGGAAAAAGYYFANPIKDGKFTDQFVKSYTKTATSTAEAAALLSKQNDAIDNAFKAKGYKGVIKNHKQYDAVKAYIKNGHELKGLPKDTRSALPASIKNAKSAEKALKAAETAIGKVKIPQALTAKESKKIARDITKEFKTNANKWVAKYKNGTFGTNVKGSTIKKGTYNAALKNFKWQKAGKFGLIAGGVILAGKLLFGNKNA